MAPNSHDAAHEAMMGGLIRRGFGGSGKPAEDCPDAEILAAYFEHSLDTGESARFETHLSNCARCREQVAAMVRAEEQAAPAARRLWFWDWRLIGAAIAALLVLSIWGVRKTIISPVYQSSSNQPLVAMNPPPEPPQAQTAPRVPAPEVQINPPSKTLNAPQSLDHVTTSAGRESEEKARQSTNESQQTSIQAETAGKSPRSFQAMNQALPAPGTADQASNAADLKKQSTNEIAAAAPAPSAPPTALSTQAARPTSAAAVPLASAGAEAPKASTPVSGGVLGALIPQDTEQRSGSTIIQTPDPKILWRIVSNRFIERTEDGGATWHGQVPASDVQLTAGSAPNRKDCWLVGRSGTILVSKDAVHWKKIPPPIPADFVAIAATSDSAATVTAADGQKFVTRNQGKTWIPAK